MDEPTWEELREALERLAAAVGRLAERLDALELLLADEDQ